MNPDSELPAEVKDAADNNRKIEAIKRLRDAEDLSLKQAKQRVEAYMADHPEIAGSRRSAGGGKARGLAIGVVLLVLGYFIYRVFAQ